MNYSLYTLFILCITVKIHVWAMGHSSGSTKCVTSMPETTIVETVKYDHKLHKKGVNLSLAKSMCTTRDTLVDVVPPLANILYVPSKVMVKRCDGATIGKQACMATNSKPKEFTVLKMDALDTNKKDMFAVIVEIEEHTKCKVTCLTKKEDCSDMQVFMPDTCMCMCKMMQMQCTRVMRWDPNECKCVCEGRDRMCSTGQKWDGDLCSCQLNVSEENWLDTTGE